MSESTDIGQVIKEATTSAEAFQTHFPTIISETSLLANSSFSYIQDFINVLHEILITRSNHPTQRFYSVYLLLKATELQDIKSFIVELARHDIVTDVFRIAQTDVTRDVPIEQRGRSYFGKTTDQKKRQIGINFVRLCYETIFHLGLKFGSPDVMEPQHIFEFLSGALKKKGRQHSNFVFIDKNYSLSYDLSTWNFNENNPPLEEHPLPKDHAHLEDDFKEDLPEVAHEITKAFSFEPGRLESVARESYKPYETIKMQKISSKEDLVSPQSNEKEILLNQEKLGLEPQQRDSVQSPYFYQENNPLKGLGPRIEFSSPTSQEKTSPNFLMLREGGLTDYAFEKQEEKKSAGPIINMARVNKYKMAILGTTSPTKEGGETRIIELEKDLLNLQMIMMNSLEQNNETPKLTRRSNSGVVKSDLNGIVNSYSAKPEQKSETTRDLISREGEEEEEISTKRENREEPKEVPIPISSATAARINKYKMAILGSSTEPNKEETEQKSTPVKEVKNDENNLISPLSGRTETQELLVKDRKNRILRALDGKTSKDEERGLKDYIIDVENREDNKQEGIILKPQEFTTPVKQTKKVVFADEEALPLVFMDSGNKHQQSPDIREIKTAAGKVQSLNSLEAEGRRVWLELRKLPKNNYHQPSDEQKWNSLVLSDGGPRRADPFARPTRSVDPDKMLSVVQEEGREKKKQRTGARTPDYRLSDIALKNMTEYENKIKQLEKDVEELKKEAFRLKDQSLLSIEAGFDEPKSRPQVRVAGQTKTYSGIGRAHQG